MSTDTYERDFYRWTQQQAGLIRKGRRLADAYDDALAQV